MFALLAAGVVVFVVALGSLLVDQLSALVDAIPGYAKTIGTELSGDELASRLRDNEGVEAFVSDVAAAAVGLSTTMVGLVLQGFTISLFTFYLVADGPRLRRTVCSVLPPGRQQVALRVWDKLAADLEGRAAAFSEIDLTLDPVDAVGDKLIAEWRVAATHTGLLVLGEEVTLEPTGRRIELRGVVIAEFERDRIRSFRQYWDEAELLEGLGLLPA